MAMSDVVIKTKDVEYEKAKNNFISELTQFQKSRGLGIRKTPKINGREVDLYLLYQIVTSHGGWEKVNTRNEWIELAEHFKLPRSSNGGVAFKQIYQKHLELYEKIHFLGVDVDGREEPDDDYDDFRHRRRFDHHSRKPTPQITPSAGTSIIATPHSGAGPMPESSRIRYTIPTKPVNSTYDKLVLTLQSPLPNEQDVAIGVCSLLSNETKHVLQLVKCPRLLDHLLAHAGVYSHCSLRELTEEVYVRGRGFNHATFWKETKCSADTKELLCEQFVNRFRKNLGLDLYENDFSRTNDEDTIVDTVSEVNPESSKDIDIQSSITSSTGVDKKEDLPKDGMPELNTNPNVCCEKCSCHMEEMLSFLPEVEDEDKIITTRLSKSTEQAGQRITQIAHVIRNLSFEYGNAEMMSNNTTAQRFLLLSLKCGWNNLSQLAWDTLGNLSKHMELNEPMLDPLSSMFISLVIDAVLGPDRFRNIRSLEILTGWFAAESNDKVLLPYFEPELFQRICQLLGINDIMLLIYTLECILSMTARGEEVCDQFARVDGALDTLVSLVTVEAQSYGPKGCIAMRVVETVSTVQPVGQLLVKQKNLQQTPTAATSSHSSPDRVQTPKVYSNSNVPARPFHIKSPVLAALCNNLPTPPARPNNNMCATSTWTPSLTQMPSSFSQRTPQPPHIPNLSASSNLASLSILNATFLQQQSSRPPVYQNTTPIHSNSPVLMNANFVFNSTPQNSVQNTTVSLKTTPTSTTTFGGQTRVQDQRLLLSPTSSEFYNPTINPPMPDGKLSEDGWAMAWLKGAFEPASGTSIEQGELYRMYCSTRRSPQTVLGMDQFITCVKTVYGSSVGPVMKQFGGGSSLSFIEGIRPKLAMRNVAAMNPVSVSTGFITTNAVPNCLSGISPNSPTPGSPTQEAPLETPSQLPVSVHIPARESKTGLTSTSPILKATLSRPPKPPTPTDSKKQKQKKCNAKKNGRRSKLQEVDKRTLTKQNTNSIVSPTSSAIRSLLASKVTQRQQKKLQQPETKKLNSKSNKNTGKKVSPPKKQSSESTLNGILDSIVNPGSEECSVSSMNSAASSECTPPPLISFQGVLQNGLSSGESSKDGDTDPPCLKEEIVDIKHQNKLKGMLVDLLERKVGPRESVNGLIGNREIRISDKGLEIVDQDGNSNSNSNMSGNIPTMHGLRNSVPTSGASVTTSESSMNYALPTSMELGSSGSGSGDNMQQQMTFYSAIDSQVTFKGQISQLKNSSSATAGIQNNKNHCTNNDVAHMSDGGGGDLSGDSIASNGTNCTVGANSFNSDNSKELEQDENACNDFDNARFAPDLIDKFNEISDLIMVSPEQLGIKRTLSTNESAGRTGESDQPPFKKPSLNNRNGCTATPPPLTDLSAPILETSANPPNGATILKTNSVEDNVSVPANHTNTNSTKKHESESTDQNHLSNHSSDTIIRSDYSDTLPHKTTATLTSVNSSTTSMNISFVQTSTTSTSSLSTSNSLVQYPVTIAMNHAPNQLTFSRQLVLPSGQPILLKTPNSQTPLQGQVIISKPSNSSNDQIPKAIIILQQPQLVGGLTQASSNQSSGPLKLLTVKTEINSDFSKTTDQLDLEIPYLCEWAGCGLRFISHQQVMMHVTTSHCSEALTAAVLCEWGPNGCDPLIRKRYSLMTHLQDRHCSKPALELALYRRKNRIEPPPPPQQGQPGQQGQQQAHHPGYAPNAAFHAIRRHALQFMNPRELLDDNEGPVTKSIRLSAALILRNICMHSSIGRRKLRAYESHLSAVGMSNVESSRTIAHLLYELNQSHRIS